jgi:hypothetical protein
MLNKNKMTCNCRNKRFIKCYNCDNEEQCVACIKKSIGKNNTYPKCLNCNISFTEDFCKEKLGKIRTEKCYQKINEIIEDCKTNIETFPNVKELKYIIDNFRDKENIDELYEQKKKKENELKKIKNPNIRQNNQTNNDSEFDYEEEEGNFNFNCPRNDCRGFVGGDFICGVCQIKVCSECLNEYKEDHKCDPNDIKSVEEIKKNCKPCPNCSGNIFKIRGCNQMWCTYCKTAFNWATLKIIKKGMFHNPHHAAEGRTFASNYEQNIFRTQLKELEKKNNLNDPETLESNPQIGNWLKYRFDKMIDEKIWYNLITINEKLSGYPISLIKTLHMLISHLHYLCLEKEQQKENLDKMLENFKMDYVLHKISYKKYYKMVHDNYVQNAENQFTHQIYCDYRNIFMKIIYNGVIKVNDYDSLRDWVSELFSYINEFNEKAKILAYILNITVCKIIFTIGTYNDLIIDYGNHIDVEYDELPNYYGSKTDEEKKIIKENEDCPTCLSNFEEEEKNPIICKNCNFIFCEDCVKYYVEQENRVVCMSCFTEWSELFVAENISKEFVKKTYRGIVVKNIVERELQKIPEIMNKISKTQKIKSMEKEINDIIDEIYKLKKNIIPNNNEDESASLNFLNYSGEDLNKYSNEYLITNYGLHYKPMLEKTAIKCYNCEKLVEFKKSTKYSSCIYCGIIYRYNSGNLKVINSNCNFLKGYLNSKDVNYEFIKDLAL